MARNDRIGYTKREKSNKERKNALKKMNPHVVKYIESLEERIEILEDLLL